MLDVSALLFSSGGGEVSVSEVIRSIDTPADGTPASGVLGTLGRKENGKNIFEEKKHSAWDKSMAARCDFKFQLRITRRSDVNFISIWKKSAHGRTLTDIKGDDAMIEFFAESIAPVMEETIGHNLKDGDWCIVTSPKRRHKEKNFATLISERIGQRLGIPFYEDMAECHSKHRMNAVFTLNSKYSDNNNERLPKEKNMIVYDDFVTTGQTMLSMKRLLQPLGYNLVFFTGVNNKID